ncbi:MAG: TRAM domain-containing protein, partial [Flavobacteriales bacterium]|nr:TRAM domain-containing protein [Flavobacteriales bacterium]
PRFSSQLSVAGCQGYSAKAFPRRRATLGGGEKLQGGSAGSGSALTTDNRQLTTKELKPGDIVRVRIVSATAGSLQGEPLQSEKAIIQEA